VARYAVRYPAPATGQARRSRGGPEAADQAAPANQHAGSDNLSTGAGTFAAPDRLNHGAAAPPIAPFRQPPTETQTSPNGHRRVAARRHVHSTAGGTTFVAVERQSAATNNAG